LAGAVGTLHVITALDGAMNSDEILALDALPHEVALVPPDGRLDATIAVRIDAYQQPGWTPRSADAPVLIRTAETHFVPGHISLLRVMLQGQCLLPLPGGPPPPGMPVCVASADSGAPQQTCIAGNCQSDLVPPEALEVYAHNWAANAPDVCKPVSAGPPVVQVGTGQTDYLPLTNGQTVQMELGPQGGHHVWIGVRQRNLKQSGSVTKITSTQPGTGVVGPQTSFAFTFDPDEGGFCKLAGLRYQVDVDGADYHQFLGKPLDVTVTIKDASGALGSGVAHMNIDPQLLCPSGTSGC
jgi:hypothetical protein